MSDSLLAVGLSHRDADVSVRESVYVDGVARPELRELLAAAGEVVVLSTCDRTELYIAATDPKGAKAAASAVLLARLSDGRARADATRAVVARHGLDVPRHLFRVAAGLESVVPGEPEILGQVRSAWLESQEAGTAGPLLSALFQRALETGRRVRAETPLARRPASVASATVELADRAAREYHRLRSGVTSRHGVAVGDVPLRGIEIPNIEERLNELRYKAQRGGKIAEDPSHFVAHARYVPIAAL